MLLLSIFPGVDLLGAAFETEWPDACVVRGPDVIFGGDIRRFRPMPGRFDGLFGGAPCQTFSSLANLVRAKGYEPRFGNLIPEFERCVSEASPTWFLMENVPQAPEPVIPGYGIHSFVIDNCTLDAGDGYGLEQERRRRFSFGIRDSLPTDLRRWIRQAALMLPGRVPAITGRQGGPESRVRRQAVVSDPRAVPVALGGSGKRKPGARVLAVTGAHSGAKGRPKGGHLVVYQWQEMLRLQGLPPDFLADAPFTVAGKRKAVANGVPLQLGRAIARAIREALGLPLVDHSEGGVTDHSERVDASA